MSTDPSGAPPAASNLVAFGPDANCTLELCPVEMSVYGYRPSLPANITFIALYAVAGVIHVYLGIRWKQWWYMWCLLVGCINAIVGYVGRIMLYYNPFNFVAFMIQIVCVTTGPVYYCAAIYVTIAIMINHLGPELSRFNPRLYYWIFIPCDIVSLILQGAGGGLSTSSDGDSQIGVNLAIAGMAFQVFTLLMFCVFFADYLIRYYRSPLSSAEPSGKDSNLRLKLFFGFLSAAVLLTQIRCVFRLVELKDGYTAEDSLVRHEGPFIALESCLVTLCVYCLMIAHPGFVLGKKREEHGVEEDKERSS